MSAAVTHNDVQIELLSSEDDLEGFVECFYQSFGVQTNDPLFWTVNPTINTPAGYRATVEQYKKMWLADGKDSRTKFWLKATIPTTIDNDNNGTTATTESATSGTDGNQQPEQRKIVGATVWIEALQSRNPISNDVTTQMNIENIYPGNEREQRFLRQTFASMFGPRVQVVKDAGREGYPVMILDLCCTHPDYQGRGIGRKLVQWGLNLASERGKSYGDGGTLECFTEGTLAGRPVYERAGFEAQGPIVWEVDDEFKDRRTTAATQLRRQRGLPV